MDSDPVRRQGPERDNAEGEVVLGASPPARRIWRAGGRKRPTGRAGRAPKRRRKRRPSGPPPLGRAGGRKRPTGKAGRAPNGVASDALAARRAVEQQLEL